MNAMPIIDRNCTSLELWISRAIEKYKILARLGTLTSRPMVYNYCRNNPRPSMNLILGMAVRILLMTCRLNEIKWFIKIY